MFSQPVATMSGRRSSSSTYNGETRPLLVLSAGHLPNVNQDYDMDAPYGQRSAHVVPRRAHSMHTNLVFATASTCLTLAFTCVHLNVVAMINVTFFVGALLLAHAFAMLTHWSFAIVPRPWSGIAVIDVISTGLKVPSALLLAWQPIDAIFTGTSGSAWSNFAGIAALAVLNTVNGITLPMMLWQRGKFLANFPTFGAWLFVVATYALTVANAVDMFQPGVFSPPIMQALQFGGALGYFVGAWVFFFWAFTGTPLKPQ